MVPLVSGQLHIWFYLNFLNYFWFGVMLLGATHLAPGSRHISEPKIIAALNYIVFAFGMFVSIKCA